MAFQGLGESGNIGTVGGGIKTHMLWRVPCTKRQKNGDTFQREGGQKGLEYLLYRPDGRGRRKRGASLVVPPPFQLRPEPEKGRWDQSLCK